MTDDDTRPPDSREQHVHDLVEKFIRMHRACVGPSVEEFIASHSRHADLLRQLLGPALLLEELSETAPSGTNGTRLIPKDLGDFRLLRELGRGGMGVVYEAEQLSLGRLVAVKVLPFASLLDERQRARFKNEARAAAMLKHPHIVSVHQVGYERGVHFYAMELIEGQNLAQIISSLDLSASRKEDADTAPVAALSTQRARDRRAYFDSVVRLTIQAAEAVHYAHQEGVIHRDLKPSNLLLDRSGRVHVSDFGLARIQDDDQLTLTGDLLGTLRYMSPEQASGEKILDHRTDVYSLGITLYELLTVAPAFATQDRRELLEQIDRKSPPTPRSRDATIPADLEKVVMKAIAKSPDDRYVSAKEFADDLARFLQRRPVQARRPSTAKRLQSWAARNRALAAACAVTVCALVALAVGGVVVAIQQQQAASKERSLRTQFQGTVNQLRQTQRQLTQQVYDAEMALAFAAYQRRDFQSVDRILRGYFPANEPDLRGFEWFFLWKEAQRVLQRPGIDTSLAVRKMARSPDGLRVAASEDERLGVYDIGSWEQVWVKSVVNENVRGRFGKEQEHSDDAHAGEITDLLYSADGKHLITAGLEGTFKVWDAEPGAVLASQQCPGPVWKLHLAGNRLRVLTIAEDARQHPDHVILEQHHLAFGDASVSIERTSRQHLDKSEMLFADAASANSSANAIGVVKARAAAFSSDGSLLAMAGQDGKVCLWETASGRWLPPLVGHTGRVTAVAFAPHNNELLASTSADHERSTGEVRAWNPLTGAKLGVELMLNEMGSLSFFGDANWLASGGVNGEFRIHDVAKLLAGEGSLVRTFVESASDVSAVSVGDTNGPVFVAYANGSLRLFPVTDLQPSDRPELESTIMDFSIVPNQNLAVTAHFEGTLKLRDLATGEILPTIQPEATIEQGFVVDVSPDGRFVVFGGGSWHEREKPFGAYIWDRATDSHRPLFLEQTQGGTCTAAVFSPSGDRVAIDTRRTISIYDVRSAEVVAELQGHSDNVDWLAWSVDDVIASLTWGPTREIKLWQAGTGQCLGDLVVPDEYILGRGCFSHDGRLFAVGTMPGDILIYDVDQRTLSKKLTGHGNWVPGLAFSPDDKRLASCAWDRTVRLWDLETGNALQTFANDVGNGWCVQFTSDGKTLIAAGDGTTGQAWHIWRAASAEEADAQRSLGPPVKRHGVRFGSKEN